MFEAERITAKVHKVQYDGKQEAPEPDEANSSGATRNDAIITVTLEVPLPTDTRILAEVETKYFPGTSARAAWTKDKSRYFKDSLKLRLPEQTLEIFEDGKEENVLAVVGVELHPPITLICKDGISNMYVRVQFTWQDSLNILKALDQCSVEFSLQRTQAEFDSVLAAATEFDDDDGFDEAEREALEDAEDDGIYYNCAPKVTSLIRQYKTSKETVASILTEMAETLVDVGKYKDTLDVERHHTFTVDDVNAFFFDSPEDTAESASAEPEPEPTIESKPATEKRKSPGKKKATVAGVGELPQSHVDNAGDWDPYAAGEPNSNNSDNATSGNDGSNGSNGVPVLATTASEKPVQRSQVDYRLCKFASAKAQDELDGMDPAIAYQVGQHAALLAFDQAPALGRKLQITIAHFKEAKKAILESANLEPAETTG